MSRKKLSYSVKFKLTVVEECTESGLSRRDEWLDTGNKTYTKAGNMRAATQNLPEPELSPIGKRRRI